MHIEGLIADRISLSDNNSANSRASYSSQHGPTSISLKGKFDYSGLLQKPL